MSAIEIIRKHLDDEKRRINGANNAVTSELEKLLVDVALAQAALNVRPIVEAEKVAAEAAKIAELTKLTVEVDARIERLTAALKDAKFLLQMFMPFSNRGAEKGSVADRIDAAIAEGEAVKDG